MSRLSLGIFLSASMALLSCAAEATIARLGFEERRGRFDMRSRLCSLSLAAYVVANIISPGGEIDIMDPGGYGPVVIDKALSIVNDGVGTAGLLRNSGADPVVTISAQSTDDVLLRGLTIDGLGSSTVGVQVDRAQSVTIANCVIRHFTDSGVLVANQSPLQFVATETTSSENDQSGFSFAPVVDLTASLTRVTAAHNKNNPGLAVRKLPGESGIAHIGLCVRQHFHAERLRGLCLQWHHLSRPTRSFRHEFIDFRQRPRSLVRQR